MFSISSQFQSFSHQRKSWVIWQNCNLQLPYACHHKPLLITSRSWIQAIHKDRIFWKNLLKNKEMVFENGVKNIQVAVYDGARTVGRSFSWLETIMRSEIVMCIYYFYRLRRLLNISQTRGAIPAKNFRIGGHLREVLQQSWFSQNGTNCPSRFGVEHFDPNCQRFSSRSFFDSKSCQRF